MEREPDDRMKELTYLTICLSDSNLSATARIYGYMSEGLVGCSKPWLVNGEASEDR